MKRFVDIQIVMFSARARNFLLTLLSTRIESEEFFIYMCDRDFLKMIKKYFL